MKKIKLFLTITFFAITLSSCLDDNSKQTVSFNLSFTPSEEMLKVADVSIFIKSPDGTEKTIPFPGKIWNLSLTNIKLPCLLVYQVKIAMKSGVVLDQSSYDMGYTYKNQFQILTSNGGVVTSDSSEGEESYTIPKENLEKYIKGNPIVFTYSKGY